MKGAGRMAYNEDSKKRTMKYLEKLKEIRFRVKPEEYEKYERANKQRHVDNKEDSDV